VTDFIAADGSNNIAITADVSDPDRLKAVLAWPPPDMLARMQEHGVVPAIAAYVQA
jgi:hypothetical protein